MTLGPELNIYQDLTRSVQHVFHSSGKQKPFESGLYSVGGLSLTTLVSLGYIQEDVASTKEYDQETFKVRL